MRKIFVGPDGVRSGWRLLVHLVLLGIALVLGLVATIGLAMYLPRPLFERIEVGLYLSCPLVFTVLVATALPGLLFDRSLLASGLGGPLLRTIAEWIGGALVGALAVLAAFGLVVGVCLAVGTAEVRFDGARGWLIPLLIPGWIAAAALEELLMRGYGFVWSGRALGNVLVAIRRAADVSPRADRLLLWLGRSPITLASALFFAALHIPNPGGGMLAFLNTALAGIWLSTTVYRTRSLHVAIAAHASWNAVMGMGVGIAVSGLEGIPSLLRTELDAPDWISGPMGSRGR